ncbi:hypothetical protein H2279_06125 [Campylobacter sp. B0100352/1]|uniref:Periplasmic protein n=1 Tax=Campylobacter taeniopygiae TaxID=2510188 RepID=A0ABY2TJM0_9BACT|nr:hypothetical protein [Campylobacter sp. B0100352/1]MBZ7964627.1 hypothetical protein [Campylobacter sp. 2457A]TKX33500.1 hypothetical protein CQA75_07145 [Campylobacter taeniopygiae]
MKKYLTIGILSILLLSLFVVVLVLISKFKANSDFIPEFAHNVSIEKEGQQKNNEDFTWQEELAKWPSKNFTPAAEQFNLYVDVDTSDLKEKSKYYQLIVDKNDIYSVFCLKQTLKSFDVKYFLLKSSGSPEIFLDTDNKELIDEIIKELKKYKISTQAKEIWL